MCCMLKEEMDTLEGAGRETHATAGGGNKIQREKGQTGYQSISITLFCLYSFRNLNKTNFLHLHDTSFTHSDP